MKKHLVLILIIAAVLHAGFSATAQQTDSIKVMSWNIRLDVASDGSHQWKYRRGAVASFIMQQQPDVFGVQEALHNQMKDLKCKTKGYKAIGVGRDDGAKGGEYNSLYFKSSSLSLVRQGTFWLSQTPDVAGSRGWDAACNRVATWAEFEHRKSGKHFFVMNTHFDHMGDTARVNSAILIKDKLGELAGKLPAILMGDFNVSSDHRVFRILTYPENEVTMSNTRQRQESRLYGPDFSFIGFERDFEPEGPIDFIFATWNLKVGSSMFYDFRNEPVYWSDHLPLIVVMALPEK